MSDRALLARRRRDKQYDLYQSQWADTTRLVWAATNGHFSATTWQADTAWRQCGRSGWQELTDELSYLNCDLCLRCVVSASTAYLPVWAGVPARGTERVPAHCGALVRVNSLVEYEHLRRRLRRVKEQLGMAIERGELDMKTAQRQVLATCQQQDRHVSVSARRIIGE